MQHILDAITQLLRTQISCMSVIQVNMAQKSSFWPPKDVVATKLTLEGKLL